MKQETAAIMKSKHHHIMFTLLLFMPVIGMAVDLVAPSLPAISHNLNLSDALVKGVISIYLLGYALGNFFIGFLADAIGRQKLIRISMLAFAIFSLLPIIWPDVSVLLFSRFGQGLAIGAVAVLIRTIFSDLLEPERLVKLGPVMGAMWGLGPVIGPVIGGYLQFYFNWQAGFVFFLLIAIIFFLAIFVVVPETIQKKQPLSVKQMSKSLREILSHSLFMAFVVSMGISYAMIITFQTLGPFLIQGVFGHSAAYFGRIALIMGAVFLPATFLCRYLLKYYQVRTLFSVTLHSVSFLLAILLIINLYLPNSYVILLAASLLMFFVCGFVFPLSMGKGMSLFRHISGAAAAVMYLINVLITSLISFLESFINADVVLEVVIIYSILTLLLLVTYWWKIRKNVNS
ncbi:MFS transporter [Thiotrichales bacterium 19S3-7]|nr:MFS transporter [Thiotrichales bacterium 19S3-7]MCF6801064.1 MFS transporter [Thiotrichales bacterium 19S3-11]